MPSSNVRVLRLVDGNAEITLYRGWGPVLDSGGLQDFDGDIFIITTNSSGEKIPWNAGLQAQVESNLQAWYDLGESKELGILQDSSSEERFDQIEAGLIELAALIAGGE